MPTLPRNSLLPKQFTYPYYYTPHPLAELAVLDLKRRIALSKQWSDEISRGKMFGVLVVEDSGNTHNTCTLSVEGMPEGVYYIAAFSGLLAGKNRQEGFVPPVFDLQQPGEYYHSEESEICRMPMGEAKSLRSRRLQLWLFEQYRMLNAYGEIRSLTDIFDKETCRIPPSGAGECCAPKLLQYAYTHHLRPLCMAEFWLGASPKGEIRYDGEYYPACQAKCKPILTHMLKGLDVEENPLLPMMRERARLMEVLYDDSDIIAVYKPAGMLAVRGNIDAPSVESVVAEAYPEVSGPLIVHRLDMDTSGIMLIAKNKQTHKELQTQFFKHEIKKRYVALLCGKVAHTEGIIDLPLSPDPFERPRQRVNREYGKAAITHYEILKSNETYTLAAFYPQTGRTHQLRVHAASDEGLGCPIVGDRLYSKGGMTRNEMPSLSTQTGRMMLHAESIEFIHPKSLKRITLISPLPPDFQTI